MAEAIRMPKMSDTMEEGVIASWQKKVGDTVESGDILAEVETDKATMELEAYDDGTLLHIAVEEGGAVAVDGMIAIIGEEGENIDDLLKGGDDKSEEDASLDHAPEPDEAVEEEHKPVDTSNINATIIRMPKMSDTMEEGVIASWQKKVGDAVESGDVLAEVETDKATMELEAYDDGTLLYIGVESGESVPVDGTIAIVGEEGADYKALLDAENKKGRSKKETASEDKPASAPAPKPEEKKERSQSSGPSTQPASPAPATTTQAPPSDGGSNGQSSGNGRIFASPLAKRMAREMGYDIAQIKGTGDHGRVTKKDVEAFVPSATEPETTTTPQTKQQSASEPSTDQVVLPQAAGKEDYTESKVTQMRKTIAKRLAESKFSAPHFYLTMEIDMDKAIEARKGMNETAPVKISFNDMVIKAAAMALRKHPGVNASWQEDTIRYNKHVHVGVAVAVEEGLLVPVIRFADNKSLSHIGTEVKQLAGKAKEKKLQPQEWEGNTFSISNLGMFGIDEFTAIINPPDSCILAVGGIKETPVVKHGEIVPGNIMKVTLSCDHRVVDGATGAAFLQTFKNLLEDPVRMLI